MLFKDLKPGQKFKFKFDADSDFIYEKLDCVYFKEVSVPLAYGFPSHCSYNIAIGNLDSCEVVEV
jgi:hypothetical protein